jgi:hypothetical protein
MTQERYNMTHDIEGQSEDALQQKCVFWFRNTYPELKGLLFSVPNGGLRNKREAVKLNMTGLTKGVSDLLFMYDASTYCIELKTETGTQKPDQKVWESVVTNQGFPYLIVRSLKDFKILIGTIV